jgi:hypothetical protein
LKLKYINGGLVVVCLQRVHAHFYCGKSMVKVFGHASKPLSLISKLKAYDSTSHPFIGGQNHGKLCDSSLKILCDNNMFI